MCGERILDCVTACLTLQFLTFDFSFSAKKRTLNFLLTHLFDSTRIIPSLYVVANSLLVQRLQISLLYFLI